MTLLLQKPSQTRERRRERMRGRCEQDTSPPSEGASNCVDVEARHVREASIARCPSDHRSTRWGDRSATCLGSDERTACAATHQPAASSCGALTSAVGAGRESVAMRAPGAAHGPQCLEVDRWPGSVVADNQMAASSLPMDTPHCPRWHELSTGGKARKI